jgi:hypothetical protein
MAELLFLKKVYRGCSMSNLCVVTFSYFHFLMLTFLGVNIFLYLLLLSFDIMVPFSLHAECTHSLEAQLLIFLKTLSDS